MLILKLLAAVLAGYGAHQSYGPSRMFGERWGQLMRYGIGAVLLLPFVLIFQEDFKTLEARERTIAGYMLAAIGVGAGVFLGHLADRDG